MNLKSRSDLSIRGAWEELEKQGAAEPGICERLYRRLELEKEAGVRLGCVFPGAVWEMLIEVGTAGRKFSMKFPSWKGMSFEMLSLNIPAKGSKHIRLFLEQPQNKDIFVTVCADLAKGLDGCMTNSSRSNEIENFLTRWSKFFERHGVEGLTAGEQRGLFGELWWLRTMLGAGIDPPDAVRSWKGCENEHQDFELAGQAVEVKTTMTKEPRRVWINSERQLDTRGFHSLHLFVLTITTVSGQGETLPDLIRSLRTSLPDNTTYAFENSLHAAGFLDIHGCLYGTRYARIKEELFQVTEGFPRITSVPPGIGDLTYSIVLSACTGFVCQISEYLKPNDGEADGF